MRIERRRPREGTLIGLVRPDEIYLVAVNEIDGPRVHARRQRLEKSACMIAALEVSALVFVPVDLNRVHPNQEGCVASDRSSNVAKRHLCVQLVNDRKLEVEQPCDARQRGTGRDDETLRLDRVARCKAHLIDSAIRRSNTVDAIAHETGAGCASALE